jgi:Holliday junction DNA helicase RuvA
MYALPAAVYFDMLKLYNHCGKTRKKRFHLKKMKIVKKIYLHKNGFIGKCHFDGIPMIGKLKGHIDTLKPNCVIIDVHGVGYQVFIPFSTYSAISSQAEASLLIYTHVKEDQLKLYGFFSQKEKDLFEILLGVNGIGPSIALSILSGIDPDRLFSAVESGDAACIMTIPGIGRSKAEKLLFELQRILKKKGLKPKVSAAGGTSARDEAVEALVALGFDEKKAAAAVNAADKEHPGGTLEVLIKESLAIISGIQ